MKEFTNFFVHTTVGQAIVTAVIAGGLSLTLTEDRGLLYVGIGLLFLLMKIGQLMP